MISLAVVFSLLFVHWIADFILQSDWQAKNKSKNNEALLRHTISYSMCFMFPIVILIGIENPTLKYADYVRLTLEFTIITFICHTITDYFTSRLNTWLLSKNQTHYFFVSVGFDQILHYVQLFLTFYYLTKI